MFSSTNTKPIGYVLFALILFSVTTIRTAESVNDQIVDEAKRDLLLHYSDQSEEYLRGRVEGFSRAIAERGIGFVSSLEPLALGVMSYALFLKGGEENQDYLKESINYLAHAADDGSPGALTYLIIISYEYPSIAVEDYNITELYCRMSTAKKDLIQSKINFTYVCPN